VVVEEGRQAVMLTADEVGVVGEEVLGGAKHGVGSRGSGNGRSSPAPGLCSWQQGTRRWASALGTFSWRKLLETWPDQHCEVVHLEGGLQ
jgi:hypothetical protein